MYCNCNITLSEDRLLVSIKLYFDINVMYTKDLSSVHFIKLRLNCNQQGLRVDIKGDVNCASDKLLTRMTSKAMRIAV